MKRTKEEAEQTRQDIIDAGLRVFSRSGLEAARVEDIARDAGVTRGAFYYHFRNKIELYVHLLSLRADYYRETIERSFDPELTPFLRLKAYMDNILKRMYEDEKFRAINEMIYFKSGKEKEIEQITSLDEMQYIIPTGIFVDTIEEAKANDELIPGLPTGYMVMAIFIFLQGAISFSIFNKGNFSLEETAEGLVATFLSGIAAR